MNFQFFQRHGRLCAGGKSLLPPFRDCLFELKHNVPFFTSLPAQIFSARPFRFPKSNPGKVPAAERRPKVPPPAIRRREIRGSPERIGQTAGTRQSPARTPKPN